MHRQGWQTATLAMATVVGAPIGGFLAGGPGWRWIFIVNLPISLFALALGTRSLPGLHHEGERHSRRFDLLGATFVAAAGASIVVLASSRSLARSPLWAAVLAGVALAPAIGLTRTERRAASPLIPRHLASDPGLARSAVVTFFSGIALFGSFTFVPLILVAGTGQHPTTTGLLLLPMAIGQLAATSSFATLANRGPAITSWGRLGLGLGAIGLGAIAALPALDTGAPRTVLIVGGLALAGAALGLSLQAYTLIGQARAPSAAVRLPHDYAIWSGRCSRRGPSLPSACASSLGTLTPFRSPIGKRNGATPRGVQRAALLPARIGADRVAELDSAPSIRPNASCAAPTSRSGVCGSALSATTPTAWLRPPGSRTAASTSACEREATTTLARQRPARRRTPGRVPCFPRWRRTPVRPGRGP